jgi:hypothetical protein
MFDLDITRGIFVFEIHKMAEIPIAYVGGWGRGMRLIGLNFQHGIFQFLDETLGFFGIPNTYPHFSIMNKWMIM